MNNIRKLSEQGQSIWLDYIRRNLITDGELKRLIEEDGLRGMTSNPSIFEKAIAGSTDYNETLEKLFEQKGLSAKDIYEKLAIRDIQDAADLMYPVYSETHKKDGYVSLEISPGLARDTQGSLEEARRLWKEVSRENVMIKVPGTDEGIPVIKQLISEGVNVNITLLFSQDAYLKSLNAYVEGLEERVKRGQDIASIASVASFFVSRIDSLVDRLLEEKKNTELEGRVAIANAKQAYQSFKKFLESPRWKALEAKGAQKQRLLWASTGTKNPKYSDVLYLDQLIGPDTVNTVPPATYDAFLDHGKVENTLEQGIEDANLVMEQLKETGISFSKVTNQLLEEGIVLFAEAFEKLLAAVSNKQAALLVDQELHRWNDENKIQRLWAKDASLWTSSDEDRWMGWLDIVDVQKTKADELVDFAKEIQQEGFTDIALLGMGGSSLCPQVLLKTFGSKPGYPRLHVLDSTDPAQISTFEKALDLKKTLFVVSSKSGSALEPNIFKQYFFAKAPATQFVAITDPGSKLEALAKQEGFRKIFHGVSSIGGRYSALSHFGLVPAALMGLDIQALLLKTDEMVHACGPSVLAEENPGVLLGVWLGSLASVGCDKVTLVVSSAIRSLGAWLEQLLAESTGKQGKGLIPVDQETLGKPKVYGKDRAFVYVCLETHPDVEQDKAVVELEKAGHNVMRIQVPEIQNLGAEFFRWEFATAVAGSVLGIHPFDQPDVEASKIETRRLTDLAQNTGSLPEQEPVRIEKNLLKTHLSQLKPGDYFSLLAYVEMNDENEALLQKCRLLVRDHAHVATCLGFGPRFLHSTGQVYKGGPNSGVFLQITCDDVKDLAIPDQKYTFGVVKEAQARGDLAVLKERGRRALTVRIKGDVKTGLQELCEAIRGAF